MPRKDNEGFTLAEVLVAFVILSIVLAMLTEIWIDGFRGYDSGQNRVAALRIGQAKLAETGLVTPLEAGFRTGRADEKFEWAVAVEPYVGRMAAFPDESRPFWVTVTVKWRANSAGRLESVSLKTLKAQVSR